MLSISVIYPIGKEWIALTAYRIDIITDRKSDFGFSMFWDLLSSICKNLILIISKEENILVAFDISENKTRILREQKQIESLLIPVIESDDFGFITLTKLHPKELELLFFINRTNPNKELRYLVKKNILLIKDLKLKGSMLPTMKTLLDFQCQLIFCSRGNTKQAMFLIDCVSEFHEFENKNKKVLKFFRINHNLSGAFSNHIVPNSNCGLLKWILEIKISSVKHEINQSLVNLIPDLNYHFQKMDLNKQFG